VRSTGWLAGVALAVLLAGCGSGPGSSSPAAGRSTPPQTPVSAPTSPPARSKPATPADAVAAIQAAVPQVSKVIKLNAANDPNDLLGRPNGYTAAWRLYDSRASCDSPLDTTCGAAVEVWPTRADATARSDYIQAILKNAPALGSEYDTVAGPILLRVTGKLTPAQAAAYAKALGTPEPSAVTVSAKASEADALRTSVQGYSDAYLTGQPIKAYNLLSGRCKERMSLSYFTGLVTAAKQQFGSALPFKTYDAQISGNLARVTYMYDVVSINQVHEPWVKESGSWKEDDC